MSLSTSSHSVVFEKASFVLGRELCENKCGSMLDLVKSNILDVWELTKVRLYGDNPSVDCAWGTAGCRWWRG